MCRGSQKPLPSQPASVHAVPDPPDSRSIGYRSLHGVLAATGTCVWTHTPASQPAFQHWSPVSVHGVLSALGMCRGSQVPCPSHPGLVHSVPATSSHGVLAATATCCWTHTPASQPASQQSIPVSVHGVLSGLGMCSGSQLPDPSHPGLVHSVPFTSSHGVLAATATCVCTHTPASQPGFQQSIPVSVHGVLSGLGMCSGSQVPFPSHPGSVHSVPLASSHGVLAATGTCSCTQW